ncbi:hypothetical protein RZS08_10620, partial [Arthrospira platensis SPKY1]|nr:hypothetical protein [Arthrospira platensis SPKY1]
RGGCRPGGPARRVGAARRADRRGELERRRPPGGKPPGSDTKPCGLGRQARPPAFVLVAWAFTPRRAGAAGWSGAAGRPARRAGTAQTARR